MKWTYGTPWMRKHVYDDDVGQIVFMSIVHYLQAQMVDSNDNNW